MLLLIAAIGTTRMACDEGRQVFTPPRGPFSLHPLVALVQASPGPFNEKVEQLALIDRLATHHDRPRR
jgi:hypothetical protein